MGLDQAILRNKTGEIPEINEEGDFIKAKELLSLRKQYWLHNRFMEIGVKKLGIKREELNCKYIPVSRDELRQILEDTKECVKEKEEWVVSDLFDVGLFYSDYDFECCIEVMSYFNRVMANCLRNEKEKEYFYWSWW